VLVEPGTSPLPGTRLLPLHGFPAIPFGLLWTGILSPLQKAFVQEAQSLAAAFSKK
jgi:hypothetical protein